MLLGLSKFDPNLGWNNPAFLESMYVLCMYVCIRSFVLFVHSFVCLFIYLFILPDFIFANILKYQICINSLLGHHQFVIKTLFSLLQLGRLKSNPWNHVELVHRYKSQQIPMLQGIKGLYLCMSCNIYALAPSLWVVVCLSAWNIALQGGGELCFRRNLESDLQRGELDTVSDSVWSFHLNVWSV